MLQAVSAPADRGPEDARPVAAGVVAAVAEGGLGAGGPPLAGRGLAPYGAARAVPALAAVAAPVHRRPPVGGARLVGLVTVRARPVTQVDVPRDAARVDLGLDGVARVAMAVIKAAVVAEATYPRTAVGAVRRVAHRESVPQGADREAASVGAGAAALAGQTDDRRRGRLAGRHRQDRGVAVVAAQVDAGPVRVARRPVAGQRAVATPVTTAQVAGQADGQPMVEP